MIDQIDQNIVDALKSGKTADEVCNEFNVDMDKVNQLLPLVEEGVEETTQDTLNNPEGVNDEVEANPEANNEVENTSEEASGGEETPTPEEA